MSCMSDKNNVTGVLCFKMINATPVNGMTKTQISKFEKMLDSLKLIKNKDANSKEIFLAKLDSLGFCYWARSGGQYFGGHRCVCP